MRTIICLFGLLALSPGMRGQQTFNVTPQTLAGWTVIGTEPQTLSMQAVLSLPAGAQLVRSFRATGIDLTVTTTPVVGLDTDDWPVLEIGNAALLFARNGTTGRLVLVAGDNMPVDLPLNFALDADGVSVDPVTVSFSRQGAMVSIGMSGRTLQVPIVPVTDDRLEIVASAGANLAWSFDVLEVTAKGPGAAARTGEHFTAGSGATDSNPSVIAKPLSSGGSTATLANVPPPASGQLAVKPAGTPTRKATLEIFTPPAIRHGRAAAVHAAVQRKSE